MISCPVCEHQQAHGIECEVCGKRLAPGVSAADLAIPAVEGLEPTFHAAAGTPAADPVAELEPTRHDAATAAAPAFDLTPELEATRAAPVDVEVAPVPDVERTAAGIPDDAPTVIPTFVICRYCRTPAMPGERLCTRCGVRLPVFADSAAVRAAAEAPHLCSCGMALRPGATLCPSCGARH